MKVPDTKRNGYDYFECLSALQKCMRRCMVEDGCFFASEFDLNGNGNALFARYILYADEDISLADLYVGSYILDQYDLWKKQIKEEGLKPSESWKSKKAQTIVMRTSIVVMESMKSRICATSVSTAHGMYFHGEEPSVRDPFEELEIAIKNKNEFRAIWLINYIDLWSEKKGEDTKEWVKQSLGKIKDNALRIVDVTLSCLSENSPYHRVIEARKDMMKIGDFSKLYTASVVLTAIREPYLMPIFVPAEEKVEKMRKMMYNGNPKKRGIEDYMLDQHTNKGKNLGRGLAHFYDIAAHVENVGYPDVYKKAARNLGASIEEKGDVGRSKNLRKMLHEGKNFVTRKMVEELRKNLLEEGIEDTKGENTKFNFETLHIKSFDSEIKIKDQIQLNCGGKPKSYFGLWKNTPVFIKGPLKRFPEQQILAEKNKKDFGVEQLGCAVVVVEDTKQMWLMMPDATGGEKIPKDEKGMLDMYRSKVPRLGEFYRNGGVLNAKLKEDLALVVFYRYVVCSSDTNSRNLSVDLNRNRILSFDEMEFKQKDWMPFGVPIFLELFAQKQISIQFAKMIEETVKKNLDFWKDVMKKWMKTNLAKNEKYVKDQIKSLMVGLEKLVF